MKIISDLHIHSRFSRATSKSLDIANLEKYAKIREAELDMAVKEAKADYEAGRTISESIDNHMKRVVDEI